MSIALGVVFAVSLGATPLVAIAFAPVARRLIEAHRELIEP